MLYIFDRKENLLEILNEEDYSDFKHITKVNSSDSLSFSTSKKKNIKKNNKVGFFKGGKFQLFLIYDFNDTISLDENKIDIECISDFNLLGNFIIEDKRIVNGTLREAAQKALEGMDYQVGITEDFELRNINFYFISRLKALNDILDTFKAEFDIRIEIDEATGRITNKYIDFKHRLGEDTGLRFTFDTNLKSIEKSPVGEHFNVLYGRGKSLETDNGGFSRKLDFAEVNNGKKYVEDLDSISKYGRLEGIFSDDNISDKIELLNKTLDKLQEVKDPKFTYKVTLEYLNTLEGFEHYKCQKGDTILIIDEEENLILEARILEIEETEDITITLGSIQVGLVDSDFESEIGDIKDKVNQIENDKPNIDTIYPDTLPDVPILKAKALYSSVILDWSYSNKEYYTYELFASKIKDFNPTSDNRIFEGKASSFLHEVKPSETWYYRVRAKNTYGKATLFSSQIKAITFKISDSAEIFEEAAIGHAIIKDLDMDKAAAGKLKGQYIEAKNLTVIDGNDKETLSIDSFGNVKLDVIELSIKSQSVEKELREKVTKSELKIKETEIIQSVSKFVKGNLIKNGGFEVENGEWLKNNTPEIYYNQPYQNFDGRSILILGGEFEGIFQQFATKIGEKYSVSFYGLIDGTKQGDTSIGIAGINTINLKDTLEWTKYEFTFTATNNVTTFIAYSAGKNVGFFLDNIMIVEGSYPQEFSEEKINYSSFVLENNKIKNEVKKIDETKINKSELEIKEDEIYQEIYKIIKGNLIKNGGFEVAGNLIPHWDINGIINYNYRQPWANYQGYSIWIQGSKNEGIFQRFKTTPGKKYAVSFMAMADIPKNGIYKIGIEDVYTVNPEGVSQFKKYQFVFTATKEEHVFTAYCDDDRWEPAFFLDNVMINEGEEYLPFMDRLATENFTEIKTTPTSILQSVNEGLGKGSAIAVAGTILDKYGFSQLNNGKLSVRLNNNGTHIYSFLNEGKINGSIQALRRVQTNDDIMAMTHETNSFLAIAYPKPNEQGIYWDYIDFDIYKLINPIPITFLTDVDFSGYNIWLNKKNADVASRLFGGVRGDGRGYAALYGANLQFVNPDGGEFHFNVTREMFDVYSSEVQIRNNLKVYGNKNCIQETKYGDIPFYANEDINSLLTETEIDSYLETKEVDGKFICKVEIDEIIQECLNTQLPYNVYIDKRDFGDYKVDIKESDYFIVESDRVIRFKYKLEARRKNFEKESKTNNFMRKMTVSLPVNEIPDEPVIKEEESILYKPEEVK